MRILKMIFYLSMLINLYSCQKVIELDIRDSDTKYVIEGIITNEPGVCKVYISQTKYFNEDNQFAGVSGAVVRIADNGLEVPLIETSAGTYETNLISGAPGHVYELSVSINDEVFTATCTMANPVLMDTLYVSRGPFGQFLFPSVTYSDPRDIDNKYRFVQYLNGVKDPAIFWTNDDFTDGESVTLQLDAGVTRKDDPRAINSGDTVTVEMLCLDEPVYIYWYTMESGGGTGIGNTVAPANPITNISGGALGYFSAHTIHRKTIIAP